MGLTLALQATTLQRSDLVGVYGWANSFSWLCALAGSYLALWGMVVAVDAVFSTYKPDSAVSLLRRNEIAIADTSAEMNEVWNRCVFARDLTEGAFDPWAVAGGFDPAGLVKGWAADRCSEILLQHGAEHVQINAAGNLALRGGFFEIMDGAIATSVGPRAVTS